jgi:hypothetical protein
MLDPVFEAFAAPDRWPYGLAPKPFTASVLLGLLPLTLAVLGVREGRRGRVLGVLALVLLWIALGPTLGASAVLGQVPIWKAFRYTEKMVGPFTLVVAVLAGLGVARLQERRVKGWFVLSVAVGLGLAAIAVGLLAASRLAPDVASIETARVVGGAWHVAGAVAGLAAWLLLRDRLGEAAGATVLAAMAWGGMAAASPIALHPGDPAARLRSRGPMLDAEAPGPRIVTPFTRDPIRTEPGLDWIDQAGRDHASLGNTAFNVRARVDSLSVYAAMTPGRLARLEAAFGAQWSAASRRYAGTHVVVDRPLTREQQAALAIATSGATRAVAGVGPGEVWAIPHREWASFPGEVRVVEDEPAAVSGTVWAFVGKSPAVVVEAGSRFDSGPGRVLSVERGLESLRVQAVADADTTLVIADAWWPGWEATVDGVDVPIFPADALVRAVRWPAGRHVLEMRYRPPEVVAGAFLSVLGLAALAVAMATLRRRAC